MGKTRQSKRESSPNRGQSNRGVPNKSQKPSMYLLDKMRTYQCGSVPSPDAKLSEEDIQFIRDNMVFSEQDENVPTGHLTRVERASHLLEKGLKEGDILDTDSLFRAFSREPDATNYYMNGHFHGTKTPLVIYITKGNIPHYNVTEHTHFFEKEKESWVETGKLRIDKITHYTSEDTDMKKLIIDKLNLKDYPRELEQYSDESIVSHGGFDPTPHDVRIVELSPVE